MDEVIITPLLLGLSTGVYCFTYCAPFLASYLVAERHGSLVRVVLEFIVGRFAGYAAFGAVFGYLGERLTGLEADLVVMAGMLPLALLMILYGIGALKRRTEACLGRFRRVRIPLLMGFLTGINICPPFLMSLGYVFTLHAWLKGMVFFMMFFVGTSAYFLPLMFVGVLGRSPAFRLAGRLASLGVGAVFLVYGIFYLVRGISLAPHLS